MSTLIPDLYCVHCAGNCVVATAYRKISAEHDRCNTSLPKVLKAEYIEGYRQGSQDTREAAVKILRELVEKHMEKLNV